MMYDIPIMLLSLLAHNVQWLLKLKLIFQIGHFRTHVSAPFGDGCISMCRMLVTQAFTRAVPRLLLVCTWTAHCGLAASSKSYSHGQACTVCRCWTLDPLGRQLKMAASLSISARPLNKLSITGSFFSTACFPCTLMALGQAVPTNNMSLVGSIANPASTSDIV